MLLDWTDDRDKSYERLEEERVRREMRADEDPSPASAYAMRPLIAEATVFTRDGRRLTGAAAAAYLWRGRRIE